MELARSRNNAAFGDDGLEYLEAHEIHSSPNQNVLFINIHFTGSSCKPTITARYTRCSTSQRYDPVGRLLASTGLCILSVALRLAVVDLAVPSAVQAVPQRERAGEGPGTLVHCFGGDICRSKQPWHSDSG